CAFGQITLRGGDINQAIRFFEFAAERGHTQSQDILGRIHFDRETEMDDIVARRWSELAAEHGVPEAMTRLGLLYQHGRGVPPDPKRAAGYFRAAANLGEPVAQLMLGIIMHMGLVAPSDRIEAAQWLMRSAEQGSELAQAYLEGKDGMSDLTENDLEEARR